MKRAEAERVIRERSKMSSNVILGDHAQERMVERGIPDVDVFRILRTGYVEGNPEPTEHGEWKCKITKQIRGSREAGVITVILANGRLFVKTVEWEDAR